MRSLFVATTEFRTPIGDDSDYDMSCIGTNDVYGSSYLMNDVFPERYYHFYVNKIYTRAESSLTCKVMDFTWRVSNTINKDVVLDVLPRIVGIHIHEYSLISAVIDATEFISLSKFKNRFKSCTGIGSNCKCQGYVEGFGSAPGYCTCDEGSGVGPDLQSVTCTIEDDYGRTATATWTKP